LRPAFRIVSLCAAGLCANSADFPNAHAVYFPWLREWCLSIVDAQERGLVVATMSRSTTPVEQEKCAQRASMYE
jgi:hypothetical protein